jgi:hypothetical protein
MNPPPRRVHLADITRSHDGERISLSPRQCAVRPGDYPYYGPGGIAARIDSYVYEGEYLLITPSVPRAFLAGGRFSAGPRVHVLSCEPEADPAFLCQVLNAAPPVPPSSARPAARSIGIKKLEALEFSLPGLETQRQILRALSAIEDKTVLLQDQNRILHGMIHALFDRVFIFGPGRRPLGDLAAYRPADSPPFPPGENRGAVFYNLILYPRGDLHPFFITALLGNPEFLSHAEGCAEGGIGKRRLDGERLMAFELGPPEDRRRNLSGALREFNGFAETAEKKLAANHGELRVLQKLRQSLIPSPCLS